MRYILIMVDGQVTTTNSIDRETLGKMVKGFITSIIDMSERVYFDAEHNCWHDIIHGN